MGDRVARAWDGPFLAPRPHRQFFTSDYDNVALHALTPKDEFLLLLSPVRYLTGVFLIPLAVATVAHPFLGRLRARFVWVLRPWALAQVGIGVALVSGQIAKLVVVVAFGGTALSGSFLLVVCWLLTVSYTLGLGSLALSVGAYRSWQSVQGVGIITYLTVYYGFWWLSGYLAHLLAMR